MADDWDLRRIKRQQSNVIQREGFEQGIGGSERVTSAYPDMQDWAEAFRLDMAHRYRALAILYLYLGSGGSER